jgi:formylglycine-generating enzyme required for sulfatase activity
MRGIAALAALVTGAAATLIAWGSHGEGRSGPLAVVEPQTGIALVAIAAGSFVMGSPPDEPSRGADEVQHRVTLTRSFLIGRYEVTQAAWRTIMRTAPSHFAQCARCPVERINYPEVEEFLRRLNAASKGLRYRLPTEAEWEYACRAGTATPFSTGRNLTTQQANYNGTFPYDGFSRGIYRARTTPVGTFPPNAWDLNDMHGNVWEWTSDWYDKYTAAAVVDPHGGLSGGKKVIRGGSWYFDANSARCALRYMHSPQDRGFSLGFRVAADRPER